MLEAYGAWGEKSMYGKNFLGIIRTTVLIGADGRIARIWRNVRVDGHADEVLAAARTILIRRFRFPKINHDWVKSPPPIQPYGTHLRPARECRCRTVPVNYSSIPNIIPMIMAGRRLAALPRCGNRAAAAQTQDGYTIVHAGKQVRLGPVVFWIVVGTVVLLGIWSAATATYFAFRDDVLTRLIARQAEMQYAYEDRIAELRAKVDRTTSRQLLDQEQFDQKLDQIMRRQTALESRATALGAMPDVHRIDPAAGARQPPRMTADARARQSPPRSATP